MAKKPVKIKTTFNLKKLANNLDNIVVEGLNLQAKYLNDDILTNDNIRARATVLFFRFPVSVFEDWEWERRSSLARARQID